MVDRQPPSSLVQKRQLMSDANDGIPMMEDDVSKVENILKGSLDSTLSPSPPVKIQIMGGKVCLRCKGKTLLGVVNKF